MNARYDIFLSYHRADSAIARPLCAALKDANLEVFFDDKEIEDFASITRRLQEGLATSKALLAVYSATYPTRRACQFELTAAFLAAQRAGDPRDRVLVVNSEDDICHIEPAELRDALFRRLRADDAPTEWADVASSVSRHVARLDHALGDIRNLTSPRWHGRDPLSSPTFIGRLAVMWRLHAELHANDLQPMTGAVGPAVVQVRGIGGIGKTMLTEEYALRFAAAYPGDVFWLTAPSDTAAASGTGRPAREAERARELYALALEFGLDTAGLADAADVRAALRRELEKRGQPYLWVVDDVSDGLAVDELRSWFAPSPNGKTILTTRSRRYASLSRAVEPGLLSLEDAKQLLTRHREPASEAEMIEVTRLADDLGRHALALEVAGAALAVASGPEPYADFRRALADPDQDALEFAAEFAGALATGHDPSIAATLLSSISRLGEEGTDLLRLAALLANTPIPAVLVDDVFAQVDGLSADLARARGMRARHQAQESSLSEPSGDGRTLAVHPIVRHAVSFLERNDGERRSQLRESAFAVLTDQLGVQRGVKTEDEVALLVPHGRELAAGATTLKELKLATRVAAYDHARGAYSSARALQERAFEARRQALGELDPSTWSALRGLAVMVRAQGDPAHARELQERASTLAEQLFGKRDRKTLIAMNDLAHTLRSLGELQRARELQRDALEGLRETAGERDPDTLTAANNLAKIERSQGFLEAAQQLQEQVLDARRAVLGNRHPATLTAISDLGETIWIRGELAAARELHEVALKGREEVLGSRHPATFTSMGNLARVLRSQGDVRAARELLEHVLEGRRDVLGDRHPATFIAMGDLAEAIGSQGELVAARELEAKVLEGRRQVLGPKHPATLIAMGNLAETMRSQGELAPAQELEEHVLDARRQIFGNLHPATLVAMGNLAETLRARGQLNAAQDLEEKVLQGRRHVLGERHPATFLAMGNLAETMRGRGELQTAQKLAQAVLDGRREVLGERHPLTLTAMVNLARVLRAHHELDAAQDLEERALKGRMEVLGEKHPETYIAMSALGLTLQSQADLPRAADLQRRAVRGLTEALGESHPETGAVMRDLAETLRAQGDLDGARELADRLVDPQHHHA